MKVKDLITALQKHDSEKDVVVRGYEGGYNIVSQIIEFNIYPHPCQNEWHYGEYDEDYNNEHKEISTPAIELCGGNTKSE